MTPKFKFLIGIEKETVHSMSTEPSPHPQDPEFKNAGVLYRETWHI